MKLALNFIFRGTEDAREVMRMLNSVAPHVDGIYATATQTEKETKAVQMVKHFGGVVSYFKWCDDFSAARNYAMQQVPEEYTHIFWCDTDDVVEGGEHLKSLAMLDVDAVYATYNYMIDEKTKRVIQEHPKERLFKRSAYTWGASGLPAGCLHENITPNREVKTVFTQKVVVNHYPNTQTEDRSARNTRILEKMYKDEGKNHDPRTEFYLARQYFDNKEYTKCEELLYDYVEHSGWKEEVACAWELLGEIYRMHDRLDEAVTAAWESIRNDMTIPSHWILLATIYADQQQWDAALFVMRITMRLPYPKTAMVLNPLLDEIRSYETLFRCAFAKRKIKEAYAAAKHLEELLPDDKAIKERVTETANILKRTDMALNLKEVVKEAQRLGEDHVVASLLGNLPSTLSSSAFVEALRQEYLKPCVWPEKSIAWYCGPSVEPWDDTSLAKGIGGSEQQVIYLSALLSKMGWAITIYGDPFKEHTDAAGVVWKQHWRFNSQDTFDVLIGWRNPSFFSTPFKARKRIVDLHDVPTMMNWEKRILDTIDGIFVKSKYHKQLLTPEAEKKAIVIPNGYDPSLVVDETKIPHRVVYASSYDRGLEGILRWGWPIVKKLCPTAELHVYYGWNTFDRFHRDNPERMAWKDDMVKMMNDQGVVDHGRVPVDALMKEKAKARIHWYPTTFQEIDCISVRESAAVGTLPYVTSYAALPEKPYVKTIIGNPFDRRTIEAMARELADLLNTGIPRELEPKYLKQKVAGETWLGIAHKYQEALA